jgi:hypothetical protein
VTIPFCLGDPRSPHVPSWTAERAPAAARSAHGPVLQFHLVLDRLIPGTHVDLLGWRREGANRIDGEAKDELVSSRRPVVATRPDHRQGAMVSYSRPLAPPATGEVKRIVKKGRGGGGERKRSVLAGSFGRPRARRTAENEARTLSLVHDLQRLHSNLGTIRSSPKITVSP